MYYDPNQALKNVPEGQVARSKVQVGFLRWAAGHE